MGFAIRKNLESGGFGLAEGAGVGAVSAVAGFGAYRAISKSATTLNLKSALLGGAIAGGIAGVLIGANLHPGKEFSRTERAVAGMFVVGSLGAATAATTAIISKAGFREVAARFAGGAVAGAAAGAIAGVLAMGMHYAIVKNDGH